MSVTGDPICPECGRYNCRGIQDRTKCPMYMPTYLCPICKNILTPYDAWCFKCELYPKITKEDRVC